MEGRASWEENISANGCVCITQDCSSFGGWQRSHFSMYPITAISLILRQSLEDKD